MALHRCADRHVVGTVPVGGLRPLDVGGGVVGGVLARGRMARTRCGRRHPQASYGIC
jgi:hypothetical protein